MRYKLNLWEKIILLVNWLKDYLFWIVKNLEFFLVIFIEICICESKLISNFWKWSLSFCVLNRIFFFFFLWNLMDYFVPRFPTLLIIIIYHIIFYIFLFYWELPFLFGIFFCWRFFSSSISTLLGPSQTLLFFYVISL